MILMLMTNQIHSFSSKLKSNYNLISLLERYNDIETGVSKQLINELYLSNYQSPSDESFQIM